MKRIRFTAPEYRADGSFLEIEYVFTGSVSAGWEILRDHRPHLKLGPGFIPLPTSHCGICSTDLARRFLPYPLPQIIGHEVVGRLEDRTMVVEINASHRARGLVEASAECPFCRNHLETHCPQRMTLGIDRLPGGFAPWILAPQNGLHEVPDEVSPSLAALTEPLAAALHAVETAAPGRGERVAVLGTRRLGTLIIAALVDFRSRNNMDFSITALSRRRELLDLSRALGADEGFHPDLPPFTLDSHFDIVFDASGGPEGLKTALRLSRRLVHLKSTTGRETMGLRHLTEMVVDEISLCPEEPKFTRPAETGVQSDRASDGRRAHLYLTPSAPAGGEEYIQHRLESREAGERILKGSLPGHDRFPEGSLLPRFDLARATSAAEIDNILRPLPDRDFSLVRPRGTIVISGSREAKQKSGSKSASGGESKDLIAWLEAKGLTLQSSRCGSFPPALALLQNSARIRDVLEERFITHHLPLSDLERGFLLAADSARSIKVLIDTG